MGIAVLPAAIIVVVGTLSDALRTLGPVVAIALIALLVIREMIALRGARARRWRNVVTVGLIPIFGIFLFTTVARLSAPGAAVALGGSAGTSPPTPLAGMPITTAPSAGTATPSASRATATPPTLPSVPAETPTPPVLPSIGRIVRRLYTEAAIFPASLALHDNSPDSGGHQERFVRVVNRGHAPFTISSIAIGGRDRSDFTQSSACSDRIIPVGGDCVIVVSFAPIWPTNRVRYADLMISATGASPLRSVVSLSGHP